MREFLDECDYLIHLVRCTIHNEQPQELPEPLTFELVYKYGVHHHLANLAFESVKKLEHKPEPELYSEWETYHNRAFIRAINQSYARDEIVDKFSQLGIRWLEVQGTKIKQFYPKPEYRTMSDIDFIVDLDNLPKARDVLQSLDYKCKDVRGVEVDAFRPPNINIELHTEYFPKSSEYYSVMRPPFASVDETGDYDINEFYIYNILHIAKHYFNCGCGIRRVLDIYYLNLNYGTVIDRPYVSSILETAKVVNFAAELSSLAEKWFGNGSRSSARSEMEDYILRSGLHGMEQNETVNRMKTVYGDGVRFFKLKYFLRRLIGSKEIMYRYYPFLKRWKILYPFCRVHMAIRALRPAKLKKLGNEVKTVINTDLTHES